MFGYRGAEPVDVPAALQDVLAWVAQFADDFPDIAEIVINPVVAAREASVLSGGVRVAPATPSDDDDPRRMH